MKVKYYYLLSIIVFVAGFAIFGSYVYHRYLLLNDLLVQFDMPGEVNISIDKPGMYDIYYEGGLAGSGELFDDNKLEKSFALIVRNEDGVSMPIRRTNKTKKYSYRGRKGESFYEVNLPKAGNYEFLGVVNDIGYSKKFTLILDKGFSKTRSKTVVTAQGTLLFPIIVSLVLFLYAYSRRQIVKK